MSEWREIALTELGTVERGKSRHRPRNDPSLYGGEVPFFQTGDVKAATLHMASPSQWYSEKGVAQSRIWEFGTACITIAANISETAILGCSGCFPDSVLGFIPTYQSADAYFVKYLLDVHRAELTSAARGTTQDNLSLEKLLSYRFRVPGAPERECIAASLRAFDDLIETNRRRIEVLEEMARTIYREWFVHFRYPSHESATFIDSASGKLPEGWYSSPLVNVARVVMGQSPKSEFYNEDGVGMPFHQGVTDFGRHYPTTRNYCTVSGRSASEGDILVSVRAPVGRLNIADTDLIIGRGLAAIRALDGRQGLLFAHLGTVFAEEDSMGGGTIFKAIGKQELSNVQILQPPDVLADDANSVLSANLGLIRALTAANRRLATIRDLLLPRLVTGQIDVSSLDMDALVEDSVA